MRSTKVERLRRHLSAAGILVGLALAPSLVESQNLGDGDQFQVNTFTSGRQQRPEVGVAPNGDFVVVWQTFSSVGGIDYGIRGQRFAADGTTQGAELVMASGPLDVRYPAVATGPSGDFLVVWSNNAVLGRHYSADGTPQGAEFGIAAGFRADLEAVPNGGFVVAYSVYAPVYQYSIRARRLASDGSPIGAEIPVSSGGSEGEAAVAVAVDGDFLIVWRDSSASAESDIRGRLFDSGGNPQASEFTVNTYTAGRQNGAAVAATPSDEYVVTWNSAGSIQGQRIAANGSMIGVEFQVNPLSLAVSGVPATIGIAADGSWTVAWAEAFDVRGRRFDAQGGFLGGEFQVNTYTSDGVGYPELAVSDGGNFLVAWSAEGAPGTDTSYTSIQGRRFVAPIFVDGFESGDTQSWATTVNR